jgi:hypothetical protein
MIAACLDNRTDPSDPSPGKVKGRDIGYVLAACSREEANSVETCTVTAL